MKKSLFLICLITITALSCSGFNVKKIVAEGKDLKVLQASGVIIRIWKNSPLTLAEIEENIRYWTEGCKKNNSLPFIAGNGLSSYSDSDKFCQLAEDKSFLKYKSIGVIKVFLGKHREELSKFMETNDLDSIIFYEVDGYFASELQYTDVNSTIVIVDRSFNILYIDNYAKGHEVNEWDRDAIKKLLLDQISRRFVYSMESLDYLERK
jgi:hypothetical protein